MKISETAFRFLRLLEQEQPPELPEDGMYTIYVSFDSKIQSDSSRRLADSFGAPDEVYHGSDDENLDIVQFAWLDRDIEEVRHLTRLASEVGLEATPDLQDEEDEEDEE
jgi:hypothetical protein